MVAGHGGHRLTEPGKSHREYVAWLLWCANEGYLKARDRAILDNWFGKVEVAQALGAAWVRRRLDQGSDRRRRRRG